jgi:hypothetical protein
MHAVQVLPALAWLLSFARLPERRRLGLVWAATVGYGALVAVSLGQTAAGLAPLDLGVATAALSLLGMLLLAAAFAAALLALRQPAPAAASSSWPASSRTSTARGTGDGDDRSD